MTMNVPRTLYNMVFPAAAALAHASAWFLPKLREAMAGRRGYRGRWDVLRRELPARPVWFHVASVGEFEQARPVISALERTRPDVPVVLTLSSPSGYHFARRKETVGAGSLRFIDYLPLDSPHAMRFCLDCARPRALVLVKFDIWPNLVWETSERRIPILLIDATLSASSRRLSIAGRWLYRDVYRRIDRILAISADDARRFAASVPGHDHIDVTGDTRFDRVMERWRARRGEALDFLSDGSPTLIAGSTWPPDEARLLPAVARLLREHAALRLVVVPHEPTPEHVERLRRWAGAEGFTAGTASAGAAGTRVVIVDVVGILAEAYRVARVAYVGGGFTTGVHSVIEPAIAGIPVLFGPRHHNSFEALQLVARGGAVPIQTADDAHATLARFFTDETARAAAGHAARAYVESQLGATEKCMAALAAYL
jgi:3-deoxy-D-manno-octulosonic-acid transferase